MNQPYYFSSFRRKVAPFVGLRFAMRMQIRRFTRLTNAFSKRFKNHAAAVNLHMMHYNFARVHQTIRCTPAMEAGLSDHVWSIEEIVGLLDDQPEKRRTA